MSYLPQFERLVLDQMAFGLEELKADLAPAEVRRAAVVPPKPPHWALLSAHLPRVKTVIPGPHDTCPDWGGALHEASATSREMLDWILYIP